MKSKVSVKQIIIDVIYLRNQLKAHLKDRAEYKPIIDFVFAKDYLNEDLEIPYPKLKEVEADTGLKSHKLRKLLIDLHTEIFTYERKLNLSFQKILYNFHISFFDHYCEFTVDFINHIPKVGETISLPFVSASLPVNHFYVNEIRHELVDDTQIINFYLKVGSYSQYFHFMKDRALELNEISFDEFIRLSESELKKIIYSRSPYR